MLGGGFKYFLFSPLVGEMIQSWLSHIFQMGWFNHQLSNGIVLVRYPLRIPIPVIFRGIQMGESKNHRAPENAPKLIRWVEISYGPSNWDFTQVKQQGIWKMDTDFSDSIATVRLPEGNFPQSLTWFTWKMMVFQVRNLQTSRGHIFRWTMLNSRGVVVKLQGCVFVFMVGYPSGQLGTSMYLLDNVSFFPRVPRNTIFPHVFFLATSPKFFF